MERRYLTIDGNEAAALSPTSATRSSRSTRSRRRYPWASWPTPWSASGPTNIFRPASHIGDPRSLLALTAMLFGRCPDAWLIGVPAAEHSIGEELSATAAAVSTPLATGFAG